MLLLLWLAAFPAVAGGEPSDTAPVPADKRAPLWEAGIFGGVLRYPDYRGSDEYTLYALPLPYIVYRGRRVQADRDGVRGIFWRHPDLEFDLSFFGNPPVRGDNQAREGMDDLDPIVELGPALRWFPLGRLPADSLYLQLAGRRVASLAWEEGPRFSAEGYRGELHLIWFRPDLLGDGRLGGGLNIGCDVSDSDLNGYFYDVGAGDVRPGRGAYHAGGGYSGVWVGGSLIHELTDTLSLAAYARWENISGAAFDTSPLVETENNLIVGGAIIWTLFKSEARAAPEADAR
jgi:outer membrane scaffolding protein for murein synthesis (MipA/OmpV family)